MSTISIRDAVVDDAASILDIYAYYVKNTAITFEYEVPTLVEFKKRMENTIKKYPYLVIERDGVIEGYAYASAFVGRAAYDWSCEMTIYLDHTAQKCGLGRSLYEALEKRLMEMGILNLYVRIGYPEKEDEYLNKNSADFHEHMGFSKAGEFHKCGYKFGRWYNMICMEKIVGIHQFNAMGTLSFRYAERADTPLILQFIKELADYEKMSDEVVANEKILEEWIFDKNKAEVIFAVVDGQEVGFALFFHNFSTFLGRAGIYLEDLFVKPDYRGKGYGKAILKKLASIAVERGCGRLEWWCLNWNQPSIDFYLSLGAEPMSDWTVYRIAGDTLTNLADHHR